MKKLAPISLPADPPTEYDRRLVQMLYQYLRDMALQINALIDEATVTNYATRYDQDAATPTYAFLGRAMVGGATSAAVWQIQRLDFGADGDVTVTWAGGNSAFSNIWDDRASLTYS
jgi:hypothetical protein